MTVVLLLVCFFVLEGQMSCCLFAVLCLLEDSLDVVVKMALNHGDSLVDALSAIQERV